MEYVPPAIIVSQRLSASQPPPERSASDEELLARYDKGDRGAFEEIFRRYRKPLFHFILRFLRDVHASQDAVQDLFLRVMRDPSRFQARSRFSTWLHAVARNLCIDMLRKRRHRLAVSLDQPAFRHGDEMAGAGLPLVERIPGSGASPERGANRGMLRVKLLVCIRALPDEQRVVFLLREVGGLPFAEIAQLLHIPQNTAKSRMRYALLNLRRGIEKLGVKGGESY